MTELPTASTIAQALIRCPSVTPQEGGALHYLDGLLRSAGFSTSIMSFAEAGTPDVQNLYARIGTDRPCLLFAGHTDVVPPGEMSAWRFAPFAGEIAEGMIWGRGAVDMKGGIAAAAAAAFGFRAKHGSPKGSIGFLITGDEEGPAINGTAKLLAWAQERGERFDHCIVGEPTGRQTLGDTIKIGRRGSLNGKIVVRGRQGHVAYPQLAQNPIPLLLRLLVALRQNPLDDGTPHFDPSNLEITTVDVGNAASNVIPALARAAFNIRFNDLWTPQSLEAEIRSRLAAAAGDAGYELDFDPTNATAFLTAPGPFAELVAGAVEAETGRRPTFSTTGGTSDARFIKDYCPVIELGLVGQTIHAVDERVSIADLDKLAAIYERLIETYFASP
ncbi:MAG: succinyl-diaminopimelate desuccinylase [Methylobacteriaceae bacterium]|nr:succinyl-diaminopimelate desuccinylase [Methylobacteriaceae bacterium]MBV9703149.1 succinyl-diaminopimelate desuccinylase [Methylobacteriaceae bacterium]